MDAVYSGAGVFSAAQDDGSADAGAIGSMLLEVKTEGRTVVIDDDLLTIFPLKTVFQKLPQLMTEQWPPSNFMEVTNTSEFQPAPAGLRDGKVTPCLSVYIFFIQRKGVKFVIRKAYGFRVSSYSVGASLLKPSEADLQKPRTATLPA